MTRAPDVTDRTMRALRRATTMHPLHPAKPADREVVVELLCRAFDHDPIVNFIVRRDARRASGLRAFFEMWFSLRDLSRNEVMTSDGFRGAMLWMPSEHVHASFVDRMRVTPEFIRCVGASRIAKILRFFTKVENAHPRESHVYVQFIGIDRAARGSGLAYAYLRHAIEIADGLSRPIYAETSNPENLPIWAKAGLAANGVIELGDGAPTVWQLRRPVSTAANRV
jgi:ribosomal protein S18 acetylase RimI-like enzyme